MSYHPSLPPAGNTDGMSVPMNDQLTKTMSGDGSSGRAEDLARGERLGSLRVEGVLGRGGMGTVYSAFDERLQRAVAVKTIRHRDGSSPRARRRFLAEARALSKLNHPNICRIHDYLETPRGHFLILELVEGELLSSLISEATPQRLTLELVAQIAAAIATAHASGVVHRDLKPGNVMVDRAGQVRVLDFGLAMGYTESSVQPGMDGESRTDSDSASRSLLEHRLPGASPAIGTPAYMSPEQARGEEVGPASDVYSLMLILGVLLSGRPLRLPSASAEAALAVARTGELHLPEGLRGDLRRLMQRCLSENASDRPTAREVERSLRHAISRPRRWATRSLAAASILLTVGAGIKYSVDLKQERDVARLAQQEAAEAFELFEQVLLAADPMTSGEGEDFTVGGLLSRGLVALDEQLAGRPIVAARLRMATGKVLRNSGELEEAERQLRLAHDTPGSDLDVKTRAEIGGVLADVLRSSGKQEEAKRLYLESLELMKSYEPSVQSEVGLLNGLALLYTGTGDYDQAEAAYSVALGVLGGAVSDAENSPGHLKLQDFRARVEVNLALLHQEQEEHEEALGLLESAIAVLEETMGTDSPEFFVIKNNLARSLAATGAYTEADREFEQARDGLSNHLGEGHPFVGIANHNWAHMLKQAGEYDRAEELFLKSLSNLDSNFEPTHPRLLRAVLSYSGMLLDQGRSADASELLVRFDVASPKVESEDLRAEVQELLEQVRTRASG